MPSEQAAEVPLSHAEAFRELTWQFRKPVVAGDTVHVEAKAASKKAVRGYKGGLISLDLSLINQKAETVHRGTWTLLVKGKPDELAPSGATPEVLRAEAAPPRPDGMRKAGDLPPAAQ